MRTLQKHNMDHFPHHHRMWSNRKITALRSRFGIEGYAIWNLLLETLCESQDFRLRVEETDLELLAAYWDQDVGHLKDVFLYLERLGLVELVEGYLRAPSLIRRLQPKLRERERKRRSAARRSPARPREDRAAGRSYVLYPPTSTNPHDHDQP